MRAAEVLGPHSGGETIGTVVGELHGFFFALERNYREDGAEDFLARNFHVVADAGQDRRLEEETFSIYRGRSSTDGDCRSFFDAGCDLLQHAVAMLSCHL